MNLPPNELPEWEGDVRYGRVPSPDPEDADDRDFDHITLSISAHHLGYNDHEIPTLYLLIDPDGAQVVSAQWLWGDAHPAEEANIGRLPLWSLSLICRLAYRAALSLDMDDDWSGSGWWLADPPPTA